MPSLAARFGIRPRASRDGPRKISAKEKRRQEERAAADAAPPDESIARSAGSWSSSDGAFYEACKRGDIATVRRLFTPERALLDDGNGTLPMHWACAEGHLEVVQFLAAQGVALDPSNKNGTQPMYYACLFEHLEVAQWVHGRLHAQGLR